MMTLLKKRKCEVKKRKENRDEAMIEYSQIANRKVKQEWNKVKIGMPINPTFKA